ncbi:hypothetical protein D915_009137 [Fasciola hepatica]|uniref:Cadherin domain-containing protein n=1 Tax=Fasciola hepatica TaxID=6192 RepID=A0A4E0RTC1_FASHE|nr:hypothetical protein D915_009137 [Fasciola hepatica]
MHYRGLFFDLLRTTTAVLATFYSLTKLNVKLSFCFSCPLVLFITANNLPPKVTYVVKEEVRIHTFIGNVLLDVQFPENQMTNRSQLRTDSLSLYELSVNGANLFALDSGTADLHTAARIDREAICPQARVWPRAGLNSPASSGEQKTTAMITGMMRMMMMTPTNTVDQASVEKCKLEFAIVRRLHGSAEEQWVSLTIEIEDVDDNGPTFAELSHPDWSGSYNIWIGEDVAVGYQYPLPIAFDADTGKNALIDYSLELESLNSMEKPVFGLHQESTKNSLDNASPILCVLQPLDHEIRKEYLLRLLACPNSDNKSLNCTRLPIRVLIRDVNDNAPRLVYPSKSVHEMTISESVSLGTVLLKVEASDADDGEAGRLSFTLQPAEVPLSPAVSFRNLTPWITIDPSTGELRLARTVSAHETPTLRALVIVSDNGTPRKSTQFMLVVHISDTNNHAPLIVVKNVGCNHEENETNELTIYRTIESKSHVGLVFVSDADLDQNGMVDCWAQAMDDAIRELFGIELNLVATGKVHDQYVYMLQADRFSQHTPVQPVAIKMDRLGMEKPFTTMLIICADKGKPYPLTSSVKLTVNVVDESEQELCFEQKSYNLQLVETNRAHMQLLRIQLQEINVRAQFYLRPTSQENRRPCKQFYLDPFNGTLSIPNGIDREVAETFECLILAKEEQTVKSSEINQDEFNVSIGHRAAQAKLTVSVADVNDNAPSIIPSLSVTGFSVIEWDSHMAENVQTVVTYPFLIGTIIARDPDAGENGTVTYQLQEVLVEQMGQLAHKDLEVQLPRFDVHPQSGQVTLVRDQHMLIDRELVQVYQLRVLLEDCGHVLKRSVIANLPIYVIDVNDNAPEWIPQLITPADLRGQIDKIDSGEAGLGGVDADPSMRTRIFTSHAPSLLQIAWRKDPSMGTGSEWLAELRATDRDRGENARLTFYKLDPSKLAIGVRGHVRNLPNEALEIYSDGTMKLLSTFLNPKWLYISGVLVQDNGNSRKLQALGYFYVNLSNTDWMTGEKQNPLLRPSRLSKVNTEPNSEQQPSATESTSRVAPIYEVFTEKFKLIFTILICSGFVVIITCGLICYLMTRRRPNDRSIETSSVQENALRPSLTVGGTNDFSGQYPVLNTRTEDSHTKGYLSEKTGYHSLPCRVPDKIYNSNEKQPTAFYTSSYQAGVDPCLSLTDNVSGTPIGYELSYPYSSGHFDLNNTIIRISTND